MAEYIYSMVRARKAVGDKLILDDVTMAFLPGAKIGMVGPNGAGKSTILKIMAGLDTPSNGEAKLTPGFSVGILMQEPELDESKTVLENIQDGVAALFNGRGASKLLGWCSLDVWNVLSRHPAILDLFKYGGTAPGLATADMIAKFFGLDGMLVSKARPARRCRRRSSSSPR